MPVVDGHNDLPWALRVRAGGDLSIADPSRELSGYHTDGPRLRAGGVGAQFWSVYVPSWQPKPFDSVMEQIELVEAMTSHDPVHLGRARTAEDAVAISRAGRTASLMGAEGGHAIENDLGKLRELSTRGVRYLTLTHGDTIEWADSATDVHRHGGLTEFGRTVVETMNDLGMVVDISHVSADTMRASLETTQRPVMASHSGARSVAPHPRNVPDDVLEAVARNDGVVMVNFYPPFVVESAALATMEMFAEARDLRSSFDTEDEFEAEIAHRRRERDIDRGTVGNVVDHIEHIVAVAGVDHVGLGSDFDGIDVTPVGLEDVSTYPAITMELIARGWSDPEIVKVLGSNALRVLAAND
ncbi:Zn-dependent dipeptidase-like protein [hydrothermal vent metagenome]|uniref:Zn-dependent dipeptidase-like protein n=1 Tax=hydrothermal vent metagenome TaxID=652676 RepID=A0A3B0RNZ0_9ZZZZ